MERHPCPHCGTEGVEICAGCGEALHPAGAQLLGERYRDCGCPAGSAYRCPNPACRERRRNQTDGTKDNTCEGCRLGLQVITESYHVDGPVIHPCTADRQASCRFCHGARGGMPGNSNILGGFTVCDYCSVDIHRILARSTTGRRERPDGINR